MKHPMSLAVVLVFASLSRVDIWAQDQSTPGAGNAAAVALSQKSPIVQSGFNFLIQQAGRLRGDNLRRATLDAIANPATCVKHRSGLTDEKKNAILQTLISEGLVDTHDDPTFPGGLRAGVFPPILDEPSACPHLPQAFFSAPGSSFGGHHSYPGGLRVHESNNDISNVNLADQYRSVYGNSHHGGPPDHPREAFEALGQTCPP
jgi:hypothetical protein